MATRGAQHDFVGTTIQGNATVRQNGDVHHIPNIFQEVDPAHVEEALEVIGASSLRSDERGSRQVDRGSLPLGIWRPMMDV